MRLITLLALGLALSTWFVEPSARAQDGDDSLRTQALALNDITGDDAIKARIRELLKDKTALRKLIAEAVTIAKEKEKEQQFNYTGAYILGLSAHQIRDFDSGEVFYKICIEHASKLKDSQKLSEVFQLFISLYDSAKKYDESLFVCKKLLELSEKSDDELKGLEPFIKDKMVSVLCRQKKFDKALEMADSLIKEYTHRGLNFIFIQRKADVYRQWGKPDEAIAEYKKLQETLEESEQLSGERKERYIELYCKYPLSGVYIDAGKPDKSIEILEELVKSQPENATYHNDLGYVLADNDRKLDEAEKLVRKALDLDREQRKKLKEANEDAVDEDKDNSAYLDSLAWVYFKQKKYTEARDVMLEVVKSEDAQHMEIYDHLAEVYLALGQKSDAVKTWTKALTLDIVTPRDEARKTSIKAKIDANK